MVIAAAAVPTRRVQEDTQPEIYVYRGYAAATDAPWSEKSLDFAVKRLGHLLETYFTGEGYRRYLAVVPDKAQFTEPPEGYTPAGAQETADYLAQRLPVEEIGIAPLLSLEDYYRTDPHWRQERLEPVARRIAAAMGTDAGASYREVTLERPFYGVYSGYAALPLAGESLSYLTNDTIDACRVTNYETGKTGPVYNLDKAAGSDPYELFLSGSVSLLTVDNPNARTDRELVIFRDSFGSSLAPLLLEGYSRVTLVDIRYLSPSQLGNFLTFDRQDVWFLYSTSVLNNSSTLK